MSKLSKITQAVVLSPLLWGSLAAAAFYGVLDAGYIDNPLALRYLSGHWTAMICVTMFFVGLAALILKAMQLVGEFEALHGAKLDAIPAEGQPVEHSEVLLERLEQLPSGWRQTYLVSRLREAIEYVRRKDSPDTLDDQLRDLADADYQRKNASYGVARIVIWAIPFIGCLGTVIGISAAMANLPSDASDSLSGIVSGLGMVFDTTALALALSVTLMVVQFLIEQFEGRLLLAVDARANAELIGRFQSSVSPKDAPYDTMRELADTMVMATENLIKRQSELWEMGVQEANQRMSEQSSAGSQQLESLVTNAVAKALGGGGGGGVSLGFDPGHGEFSPPHVSLVSHEDLQREREVMLELVEMTREGSKNWPVRKSRYFRLKRLGEEIFNGSWIERS